MTYHDLNEALRRKGEAAAAQDVPTADEVNAILDRLNQGVVGPLDAIRLRTYVEALRAAISSRSAPKQAS